MKKLILASLAITALASCSTESTIDATITSKQSAIKFSAYAGSATTKGTAVDSNAAFAVADSTFQVSGYFDATADGTTDGKYFNFSEVKYTNSAWVNQETMFWPNESGTLYFGAYYPGGDDVIAASTPAYEYNSSGHKLTLGYTVPTTLADQKDVMYATTSVAYTFGSTESAVNLHFKHALTQIAFTAKVSDDISVSISEINICNVNSVGTFTSSTAATDDSPASDNTTAAASVITTNIGSWASQATAAHYKIAPSAAVTLTSTAADITDADRALMLIPQALTGWDPAATASSTGSYLAIKCTIKHKGTDIVAGIVDNSYIFIPFDTSGIIYSADNTQDAWLPGYKITYALEFGGGYSGPTTIPDAGTTPTTTEVFKTLREITYTTSVDEWIPKTETLSL